MSLDFISRVEVGSNVEMSCSWNSNNDNKSVVWHRTSSDGEDTVFWRFEGDGQTVYLDERYDETFTNILQDSHTFHHALQLNNANNTHEGIYWCEMIIAGKICTAQARSLDVIGKSIMVVFMVKVSHGGVHTDY